MKVGCTAIIYNMSKDAIALTLRGAKCRSFQGYWALPGGAVDEGETLQAALIRECMEEVNLAVSPQFCCSVQQELIKGELWMNFIFVCTSEGVLRNNEPHKFDDVVWAPLNNLPAPMAVISHEALESWLYQRGPNDPGMIRIKEITCT